MSHVPVRAPIKTNPIIHPPINSPFYTHRRTLRCGSLFLFVFVESSRPILNMTAEVLSQPNGVVANGDLNPVSNNATAAKNSKESERRRRRRKQKKNNKASQAPEASAGDESDEGDAKESKVPQQVHCFSFCLVIL